MRMKLLLLVTCSVMLNACVPTNTSDLAIIDVKPMLTESQEERWALMVGKWYSRQSIKAGGVKEEILEFFPDGKSLITFKISDLNKNTQISRELGLWGVSGDIYFSIFIGHIKNSNLQKSNLGDPYNYDAYRILQLNESVFEYEHVTTGNRYTSKKVSADYEFEQEN